MARILLVEDEADARRMLSLGLGRNGHQVVACENGERAIAALTADIEVVVTDLVMPKVDGIGLLQALSEREHPAIRIVITSFADKDRTLAALNHGAHYLLEKPFSVPRLEQVIERARARTAEGGSVEQIFQRQLASLPITERERKLIFYILKGMPNSEIGSLLGTTEQSVKSALFALYRKLGIASRGELFHLIFPV